MINSYDQDILQFYNMVTGMLIVWCVTIALLQLQRNYRGEDSRAFIRDPPFIVLALVIGLIIIIVSDVLLFSVCLFTGGAIGILAYEFQGEIGNLPNCYPLPEMHMITVLGFSFFGLCFYFSTITTSVFFRFVVCQSTCFDMGFYAYLVGTICSRCLSSNDLFIYEFQYQPLKMLLFVYLNVTIFVVFDSSFYLSTIVLALLLSYGALALSVLLRNKALEVGLELNLDFLLISFFVLFGLLHFDLTLGISSLSTFFIGPPFSISFYYISGSILAFLPHVVSSSWKAYVELGKNVSLVCVFAVLPLFTLRGFPALSLSLAISVVNAVGAQYTADLLYEHYVEHLWERPFVALTLIIGLGAIYWAASTSGDFSPMQVTSFCSPIPPIDPSVVYLVMWHLIVSSMLILLSKWIKPRDIYHEIIDAEEIPNIEVIVPQLVVTDRPQKLPERTNFDKASPLERSCDISKWTYV